MAIPLYCVAGSHHTAAHRIEGPAQVAMRPEILASNPKRLVEGQPVRHTTSSHRKETHPHAAYVPPTRHRRADRHLQRRSSISGEFALAPHLGHTGPPARGRDTFGYCRTIGACVASHSCPVGAGAHAGVGHRQGHAISHPRGGHPGVCAGATTLFGRRPPGLDAARGLAARVAQDLGRSRDHRCAP